ncbi:MAG: hypothetical protein Q9222_003005 [Ikaeria aurantiellina]
MHPRLFTSLVLIEPMIQKELPPGPNAAMLSTFRPDIFPSIEDAHNSIRRNKVFASWDARAVNGYIKHGLRQIPTALYPVSKIAPVGAVTLTTTKHQEAWTYLRPNFQARIDSNDGPALDRRELLLSPDLDAESEGTFLFHRAEPGIVESSLPFVRPSVLYMFGAQSPLSPPEKRKAKLEGTGVATGGNGGHKYNMVSAEVFPGASHLLPWEKVKECAEAVAVWLATQLKRFQADEQFLADHPSGKSERDMQVISKQWQKGVQIFCVRLLEYHGHASLLGDPLSLDVPLLVRVGEFKIKVTTNFENELKDFQLCNALSNTRPGSGTELEIRYGASQRGQGQ